MKNINEIQDVLLTSQKNSLPRRPQNQEIQLTSSELLMILKLFK